MGNCTILMSTLVPHRGETGIHTHPVDEVIYVIIGRSEGEEDGKTFKIGLDNIIYTPEVVRHDCRNFSNETM